MKNKLLVTFAALIVFSLILGACSGAGAPATVVVTVEGEGGVQEVVVTSTPEAEGVEPVTYYNYSTTDIPTLDPAVGEDEVSINYIENLFVQLTNVDPRSAEILPEAAVSWDISQDGLTYTFSLRDDIPWVYHNPVSGETSQALDADGNPRFVNAYDFQYGIRRACDPSIGSYYSSVIAPVIKGCADVLFADEVTPDMFEGIGVNALDESTLEIQLEFPAGYFLSMSPLWTLSAVPQDVIEEYGEQWYEAGNIITSGRFVLSEWVHNVRRTILRNPLMPADLQGTGNVERLIANVVPDTSTGYALWLNGEVDFSGIPDVELQTHLEQEPEQTAQDATMGVYYIAFRETKPPFDDPRVRRAFSAAYDRETHVEIVEQNQGLPMIHFAPPGIFGAPSIDEVGLGFDVEFAQEQLAEAGYPDCEGFPTVTLIGYSGEHTLNWIEFAQAQWEQNLGCSSDKINIEQMTFAELLSATDADISDEEAAHMWTLGWGPDYPDENNWVGDLLWCGNPGNRYKRTCNEIDDKIVEAREETNPQSRIELYWEIEELFFGTEGEVPFFPIFLEIEFVAVHDWVDGRFYNAMGGQQWYNITIDQAAQLAARGG